MTPTELTQLADRGQALTREIALLSAELKLISTALIHHADAHPADHVALTDADREGTRYLVRATGALIPVTYTADHVIQSFAPGSAIAKKLARVASPDILDQFYHKVETYESVFAKSNTFDGRGFRSLAHAIHPTPELFIAACLRRDKHGVPISQIRVEWNKAIPFASPVAINEEIARLADELTPGKS